MPAAQGWIEGWSYGFLGSSGSSKGGNFTGHLTGRPCFVARATVYPCTATPRNPIPLITVNHANILSIGKSNSNIRTL